MEPIEQGEVQHHWFRALELIIMAQPFKQLDHAHSEETGQSWLKWWKEQTLD